MRDNHLIYAELEDGRIRIVPEDGYKMIYLPTGAAICEAITIEKFCKNFVSEAENDKQ